MSVEEIRLALARIPAFAGRNLGAARFARLGGLTNRVYRISFGEGETYCLRLPGVGTEDYIDRKVEAINAVAAAAAGVAPEVVHVDPPNGLLLTRFVPDARTMTPELFAEAGAVARAGQALRRLHGSGQAFAFRFELFAMIDDYLGVLDRLGSALPVGYGDVLVEAAGVREALNSRELPLAPCHCDPLCENFLDTGERMWIVDWEYSGMNDPMWDLGDLSVEGGFDAAQDEALLAAYFGGPASPADRGRMVLYKAMCDLLWTLWGLIQHANGNPADDFWAYATNRFERCKRLMRDPAFAGHLEAVRSAA